MASPKRVRREAKMMIFTGYGWPRKELPCITASSEHQLVGIRPCFSYTTYEGIAYALLPLPSAYAKLVGLLKCNVAQLFLVILGNYDNSNFLEMDCFHY